MCASRVCMFAWVLVGVADVEMQVVRRRAFVAWLPIVLSTCLSQIARASFDRGRVSWLSRGHGASRRSRVLLVVIRGGACDLTSYC